MRERPILFSGPMVRAILEGRKTQTRRVVQPQPDESFSQGYTDNQPDPAQRISLGWSWQKHHGPQWPRVECPSASMLRLCPFGAVGDRLWVRETWAELIAVSPATDQPIEIGPGERLIEPPTPWTDQHGHTRWNYDGRVIAYRANSNVEFCDGDGFSGEMANRDDMPRWRPSIHMPRWASRITLEITGVRVERLQAISEADAAAEGVDPEFEVDLADFVGGRPIDFSAASTHRLGFKHLWDTLARTGSRWADNPWVWVVEFRRIEEARDAA